jgi:hypothetical protein
MAIIKCKMCGGDLNINENVTVGTCQYCGSTMTLPSKIDDLIVNLYNRANHFRRNNEFDKAVGVYESILNQDATEAEAYWGLVLCKYGIEYVEDPKTNKRVPTCHRTQYGSILSDPDYQATLEYADPAAQIVYETEAKVIDDIQKQILEISSKEEPFDVFICYKETNETGTRTPDSVLAQDLYHQLVREGFKVFFSRITLEDKLGTAYEPYIFAALNSAKVMVVVGTKPEHINAVWVKNEWKRYLALIKQGEQKNLIPAYRDMDPYELPDEFAHLQAQDMSRLGFMQDLVRGIKKLVSDSQLIDQKPEPTTNFLNVPGVSQLLERAFLCLEIEEFEKADSLLEQVLNLDPKNPFAYIGKLMVELAIKNESDLANASQELDPYKNYQMALRFADENYKKVLEGYNHIIGERLETERKESIYQDATKQKQKSKFDYDYQRASEMFQSISGYKDADEQALECNLLAKEQVYQEGLDFKEKSKTNFDFINAARIFRRISGYKDVDNLILECETLAKEHVYQKGLTKKSNSIYDYEFISASKTFNSIEGYKDADALTLECEQLAEVARIKVEKRAKQKKKLLYITLMSIIAAGVMIFLFFTFILTPIRYNHAINMLDSLQYEKAAIIFTDLGDFRDSQAKGKESYYLLAQEFLDLGEKGNAIIYFLIAGDYADASNQVCQIIFRFQSVLATGSDHSVGLKEDGTVVSVGRNNAGQLNVSRWGDIIAVAVGSSHTVGLKSDGSAVAVGLDNHGQLNVAEWENIIAIAAGSLHTVGLHSDGTVVAVGLNDGGQLNVSRWENIVAIAAGFYHTVGLQSDGTVVAAGRNHEGQKDVFDWENITAVAAGPYHTVGLKSDGTVVAVGLNDTRQLNVSGWEDIIAVAAGTYHTVGLQSDGTVVAVGRNNSGQANISDWENIISVAAGSYHTVGLKPDGTVLATGRNNYGQLNISDWKLFD